LPNLSTGAMKIHEQTVFRSSAFWTFPIALRGRSF
jgi:hypothetical protein